MHFKFWKHNKGHNSKSYGPLATILRLHLTSDPKYNISFIEVGPQTYKLLSKMHFKFWKHNKGHNSKSYGPLATILRLHLTSDPKYNISFIEVGPQTYKLLSKMHFKFWKHNKGHNSKSYGPLATILRLHLTSDPKYNISFIEVGPQT